MKRLFFLLYSILLLASCTSKTQKQEGYLIKGKIESIEGDSVLLQEKLPGDTLVTISSEPISNKKFRFSGNLNTVRLLYLSTNKSKVSVPIILDNSTIEVTLSDTNSKVSGSSALQSQYAAFVDGAASIKQKEKTLLQQVKKAILDNNTKKLKSLKDSMLNTEEKYLKYKLNYINTQDTTLLSTLLFEDMADTSALKKHELFFIAEHLNDRLIKTEKGKALLEKKQVLEEKEALVATEKAKEEDTESVEPKKHEVAREPAPDFSGSTPDGTLLSLSSVTANNKVTLIDFWASWCQPCRYQTPYLSRLYRKYHHKGFEIIGVSVDQDQAPWIQAIAADNMNWKHIFDGDKQIAGLYGISSLPHAVLLDDKGRIITYKVSGREIENELKKLD